MDQAKYTSKYMYKYNSSTSTKECDKCQENIQKRVQVEEENCELKKRLNYAANEINYLGDKVDKAKFENAD